MDRDVFLKSNLSQSNLAAEALMSGWSLSDFVATNAIADLTQTYKLRLDHVEKLHTPHAEQLAVSIREFLQRLVDLGEVEFATLTGKGSYHFLVWRNQSELVGLFKAVSKQEVDEGYWEELWTPNT